MFTSRNRGKFTVYLCPCTFTYYADITFIKRWSIHNSQGRFTVFNKGNVNCEFTVFLNELFGTI